MGDPADAGRGIGRRRWLRVGPRLAAFAAAGLDLLDGRGWYTPGEAAALFDAPDRLDAGARAVYATTALTVDMVFPACYGLLFAALLLRLFRGGAPLYLLPLASALADVLENVTIAALALSHDGTPSPISVACRRVHLGQDGAGCGHAGRDMRGSDALDVDAGGTGADEGTP